MEDSKALSKYREWLNQKGIDAGIRKELLNMIGNIGDIEERFCSDLEFGTAGLRAVMGSGTNRMNIYTVAAAARGFAETVIDRGMGDRGIVISYDSRHNSRTFAEMTARVIATAGIDVMLSDRLRPVPMLAYAIRHCSAAGGVMITASHNKPEYNGFKVYGYDGGQLDPAGAEAVEQHMDMSSAFSVVRNAEPLDKLLSEDRVVYIGVELDSSYAAMLYDMSNADIVPRAVKRDLRIVYTPLSGTGLIPVMRIFTELGFQSVITVTEQERPDGDFPTLRVPNPECEDTFEKAIEYAKLSMADIIIATDPDSDRLGVALPDTHGEYRVLTGNQIGTLLMEYILAQKSACGTLSENSFCVVSIVSSRLARCICGRYGVKLYETPTGSKYIAELINTLDDNGSERFVMGFEEGNGYLIGTDVREKDAIAAAMLIAEMAAAAKASGRRLYEELIAMYALYGYAAEKSFSITRDGVAGRAAIAECMSHYRGMDGALGDGEDELSGLDITKYTDFSPYSDMLLYELDGLDWIALRPSGTEPKLKIYFGFYGQKKEAEQKLDRVSKVLIADINKNIGH